MSGGRFDYRNDALAYELFPDARIDWGLESPEWYFDSVKQVVEENVMCDKEITELVYDVMCLLHGLDYYLSGDLGWATYECDLQTFREKWLRYHIPKPKEPPPEPKEPDPPPVEEAPLPMNPPKKKVNHGKIACRLCWYYYHQWPNPDYFCRFHGGEFIRKVELQRYQRRPDWCPIINDETPMDNFNDFMEQKDEEEE